MTDIRKCAQAVVDSYDVDVGSREAYYKHLHAQIEALRQALDSPVEPVDALIAEAVEKEREVCAQIAMDFWCDAGADAIRARGRSD